MSIVVPFPMPAAACTTATPEEDQVQAIRAMLRYLQRETQESGLAATNDMIVAALRALEHDVLVVAR